MSIEKYLNRIICDDVANVLPYLPENSVDLICTSPPYNLGNRTPPKNTVWTGKKNMTIDYGVHSDNMPEKQYQKWQNDIVRECVRVIKPTGSIFYNHKPRRIGGLVVLPTNWLAEFKIKQLIIWDRRNSPQINNVCFLPTTEHIYWITKTDKTPKFYREKCNYTSEIWDLPVRMDNPHPAPFPIELPINCILGCTDEGDVVLDPFVGSGTTAVACKQYKRNFIGIDNNPEYCEMAKENLAKMPDSLDKWVK